MTSCWPYLLASRFMCGIFVCECGASAVCVANARKTLISEINSNLFDSITFIQFIVCCAGNHKTNKWTDCRTLHVHKSRIYNDVSSLLSSSPLRRFVLFFFSNRIEFDSTKLGAWNFCTAVKDRFPRNYCNFQFRFLFLLFLFVRRTYSSVMCERLWGNGGKVNN